MPKTVDHDKRRAELAEAVGRIVQSDGYEALTMRRIAEESGWSLGVLNHYFSGKDGLLLFAYMHASERETRLCTEQVAGLRGVAALTAAAKATLCLTPESFADGMIWLAFLPRAASRDDFRAVQNPAKNRAFFAALLRDAVAVDVPEKELDYDAEADLITAFLDGLSLQALLEPGEYTPERQVQLLHAYLAGRGLAQPQAS